MVPYNVSPAASRSFTGFDRITMKLVPDAGQVLGDDSVRTGRAARPGWSVAKCSLASRPFRHGHSDRKEHLDVTRRSTVDADGLPVDVSRSVGTQEDYGVGYFFRSAITPNGNAFGVGGHYLFL